MKGYSLDKNPKLVKIYFENDPSWVFIGLSGTSEEGKGYWCLMIISSEIHGWSEITKDEDIRSGNAFFSTERLTYETSAFTVEEIE